MKECSASASVSNSAYSRGGGEPMTAGCSPKLARWSTRLKEPEENTVYAGAGPIIIGERNLIEEQAFIRNFLQIFENIVPDAEVDVEPKPMIIGTNNVFEAGCCSQAMKIGDINVMESKAFVCRNLILTSGCIIGTCCNVDM